MFPRLLLSISTPSPFFLGLLSTLVASVSLLVQSLLPQPGLDRTIGVRADVAVASVAISFFYFVVVVFACLDLLLGILVAASIASVPSLHCHRVWTEP